MKFLARNTVKTSIADLSVEELLSQIIKGRSEALEVMYDRYAGQVYAFLLRAVEPELAEELLQDVFLALWQKAGQFDATRGSFNAWFFTLVRHRVYDALRSRQHQGKVSSLSQMVDEQHQAEPFDTKLDLEEHILKLFRNEEIQQALQNLPLEQRQIILMTYFGGYSQRELAERLDVPLSTIKGRARMGLQKLRQLLPE